MICSVFKIVFGAVLAAGLLLTSDARHSLDDTKVPIVGQQHQKKWTTEDLSLMAKSHTVKDAVFYLTNDAQGSGVPELDMDEVNELIDGMPAADLRAALLKSTGMKNKRKAKGDMDIASFAQYVDPAATCATEDTAGGHGFAVCVSGCEESSSSSYLGWDSHIGACNVLCSLATSPCSKEPVSQKAFASAMSWAKPAIACAKRVIAWIGMLPLKPKAAFLLLVRLAFTLYAKIKSFELERHRHDVQGKQWRCTRDTDALKGAALVAVHEKMLKRRALRALHDFAALATYRASQEAEEAEAKAAKTVALNAAIEMVAAEQAAWDKGGGGCVVS